MTLFLVMIHCNTVYTSQYGDNTSILQLHFSLAACLDAAQPSSRFGQRTRGRSIAPNSELDSPRPTKLAIELELASTRLAAALADSTLDSFNEGQRVNDPDMKRSYTLTSKYTPG